MRFTDEELEKLEQGNNIVESNSYSVHGTIDFTDFFAERKSREQNIYTDDTVKKVEEYKFLAEPKKFFCQKHGEVTDFTASYTDMTAKKRVKITNVCGLCYWEKQYKLLDLGTITEEDVD